MEAVFRQNYTISHAHLDKYGRAKPSALLYFAQEAAGSHCAQLALDWDTLAKRGLFWAVIRHRVQIDRLPHKGETITVETWPMPTTRSAFPRTTAAYDAQGNLVFRAVSLWVLMDMHTRSMVLPGKSGIDLTGTQRGDELPFPSSIPPKPLENTATRQVTYADLDRNGHVNNARYMDWVDQLLPDTFYRDHPVREFVVCYLSEALNEQTINLHWQISEDGNLQVEGHRERTDVSGTQSRVFAAQVLF